MMASLASVLSRTFAFTPAATSSSRTRVVIEQKSTPISTEKHTIPFSRTTSLLHMSSSTLPEVSSMRVSELKKELESYGVSTKSFFEKSELVDAVLKARAEGKTPISSSSPSSSTSSPSSTSSKESNNNSSSRNNNESREEKLTKEMENCNAMKASELKIELEAYGISTKSFFEKSEFVKACAEARVDGFTKKKESSGENYAEYADVEVLTDDSSGPRKRSTEQNESQQGSNPFGGMGGMPGGMGGMADMLKNMGGMGGNPFAGGGGGGGGNPFAGGGGGGNPFGGGMPGGDTMKKAQEMMSNPKVKEIIMKAQSNPKVMKAVQECMSNPMAFAKYQNDPEVGELIRELQKYM